MPLTPEDVANKQFTSTRLKPGYDETEVDEFLDEVEAELTRLYRENDELRSKLAAAGPAPRVADAGGAGPGRRRPEPGPGPRERRAAPEAGRHPAPADRRPTARPRRPRARPPAGSARPAAPSETATGILALAQRTADEHISEARTQADRIIGEARTRADQLKREADDKHRQMIGSLENERVTLEREVEKLRTFEREYRSRLKSYLEGQLRELDGAHDLGAGRQGGGGQGGPPAAGPAARRASRPARGAARSPFSPGAPVGGDSAGQRSTAAARRRGAATGLTSAADPHAETARRR